MWRMPCFISCLLLFLGCAIHSETAAQQTAAKPQTKPRPNILIAISDDQSYPHASAYGDPVIQTPGFDRVAKAGVLFHNAFTPAPGCSPMRAAFLTGREIWQNGAAGTHASTFPRDLPVFTSQLADSGYHVGMTGKGWSPGRAAGWPHNPAGKSYDQHKMKSPPGIASTDYASNFSEFLTARQDDQPFCFWFGAREPHRVFGSGLGKQSGMDLSKIVVPTFLPDSETIRSDLADYLFEIQWFDQHLQRMLDQLEAAGELENTLVIVTSDNGMSFPRAKANLYEYGIHMPLAIAWPKQITGGQDSQDLVSLIDVTRTIFAAAGVTPKQADKMPGLDLLPSLRKDSQPVADYQRQAVFSGRERHSSSRFNSLSYPCRCIRTDSHLYIINFTPERYPAGTPQKYAAATYDKDGNVVTSKLGPPHGGYHDIDACPTLDWMIKYQSDSDRNQNLFNASVALRPAEELYDIQNDPACLNNLIDQPGNSKLRDSLRKQLLTYLTQTGDLRVTDPQAAHVWETYQRISGLRWFPKPDWAINDPSKAPNQPWLEARRPHAKTNESKTSKPSQSPAGQ